MIIGDSVAPDRWRCRGPAWLFVPADRPDRIRRAAELADHAVIDLEDGVDPADRPVARSGLAAAVHGLATDRLIVRISPLGTPDAAADLAAVRAAGLDTVMIAKAEDPELIGGPELAALRVIPLCESSRAVLRVDRLAEAPAVVAVMWGSVDLAADLGCAAQAPVLHHVRWQVLLATRAARRVAVDHALPDLDDDAVMADALTAARAGFDAKACLHPRHLPLIRAAFAPDPATLAWAEQVLATAQGSGAQRTAGGFIDHAVIARARKIIARRAHPSTRSPS
jgi:citrate lyase subunit beta/citryl-CoA lyase